MAKKLQPYYLENGKYACPVCKLRDELSISDYGLKDSAYYFDITCKRCKVSFEVVKKL